MSGPERIGRFRLTGVLGAGGMGVVHAAVDERLGRPAAVKVLTARLRSDPEFSARFHRESDLLSRIDSPHVLRILDHGEWEGQPWLATQLVAGGDLGALLRRRGPMPLPVAAGVCAQVAHALADAHRAGIVHRDVKPGNVLVHDPDAPRPHVYLADFGIARTAADGLTTAGGVAGSLPYLAPERLAGADATPASDLYALGCLLWCCLTGAPPYGGGDAGAVQGHLHGSVPQLDPGDPRAAAANPVLATLLAKHPGGRPPHALAAAETLTSLTVPGGSPATSDRPVRRRRGRRAAWAGAAAAAVLVGGGLAVVLTGAGDRDDGPGPGPSPEAEAASGTGVGDLDGDGLGDVRLRTAAGDDVTWTSTGDGLDGPRSQPSPSVDGDQVVLADVDGDGVPDELAVRGQDDRASVDVALATGAAPTTVPAVTGAGGRPAALAADLDGDGWDDLALLSTLPNGAGTRVSAMLSDGATLGTPETWLDVDDLVLDGTTLVAGDVDGDGDDDLTALVDGESGDFGARDTPAGLRLIRSEGWYAEALPGRVDVAGPDYALESVTAADVDGDGRDEIAVMTGAGAPTDELDVQLVGWDDDDLGDPTPWWHASVDALPSGADLQLAASDVDGDGLDDLALLRTGGDEQGRLGVLRATEDGPGDLRWWSDDACGGDCTGARLLGDVALTR